MALYRITKRSNEPLPCCKKLLVSGLDHTGFSCNWDPRKAFHQIPLRPWEIEKTAFNKNNGKFQYILIPIELCNDPSTFQELLIRVLHDVIDLFLVIYMDDTLIYSCKREEHLAHIRAVSERLYRQRIYVSPTKCFFMACPPYHTVFQCKTRWRVDITTQVIPGIGKPECGRGLKTIGRVVTAQGQFEGEQREREEYQRERYQPSGLCRKLKDTRR